VVPVRLGFVVLSGFGGLGAVLYAAFWAVLQLDPDRPRGTDRDAGQFVSFAALALGGLLLGWLVTGTSGPFGMVWPVVIMILGAGLIWHRADPAQRLRWSSYQPRFPFAAVLVGEGSRGQTVFRLVAGGVLVGVGLVGFLAWSGELGAARDGLLFGGVLLTGVAVVAGPWVWRTVTELRAERAERIRSQTRADIAAVVHDQVLHTLALIQRNAEDPREVARLARGQERELRNWLYKPVASPTEKFAAALEATAAEVEDTYAVTVDVVVVGDADVDEPLVALVQAAREALVNAGKHAGVATVSLYAEVEPDAVSVFVRDRGTGFDSGAVDGDRHGVSGSIIDRMERHGGSADVRTAPGEGTEVRLRMSRATRGAA
jgi:signal transduction histidine kinase